MLRIFLIAGAAVVLLASSKLVASASEPWPVGRWSASTTEISAGHRKVTTIFGLENLRVPTARRHRRLR